MKKLGKHMDESAVQRKIEFIKSKRLYQDPDIFELDQGLSLHKIIYDSKRDPTQLIADQEFKDKGMPNGALRKDLRVKKRFDHLIAESQRQLAELSKKHIEKEDIVAKISKSLGLRDMNPDTAALVNDLMHEITVYDKKKEMARELKLKLERDILKKEQYVEKASKRKTLTKIM